MAIIPMVAIKPFATIEKKLRGEYSAATEQYTNVLKETIEGYEVIRTGNGADDFQARHDHALSLIHIFDQKNKPCAHHTKQTRREKNRARLIQNQFFEDYGIF